MTLLATLKIRSSTLKQPKKLPLVDAGYLQEGLAPAAVLVDHFVDFLYQANSFGDSNDDPVVMLDVIFQQLAALAVLEPLLADLVPADVIIPDCIRHASKTATPALVDPNGPLII